MLSKPQRFLIDRIYHQTRTSGQGWPNRRYFGKALPGGDTVAFGENKDHLAFVLEGHCLKDYSVLFRNLVSFSWQRRKERRKTETSLRTNKLTMHSLCCVLSGSGPKRVLSVWLSSIVFFQHGHVTDRCWSLVGRGLAKDVGSLLVRHSPKPDGRIQKVCHSFGSHS